MTSETPKRIRYQFRFWLDAAKDDELELCAYHDQLKERRQWQPTIRDALRLIRDLRAGRVNVLLELFPSIERIFEDRFLERHGRNDSPATAEFTAIMRQQAAILEQLANGQQMQPAHRVVAPQIKLTGDIFTSETADPSETRQDFAASMGNLFADDDDLWD